MKRIVWTFGLIAGTIFSLMMIVSMSFVDQIGFDNGEIIGYTTMIAAFLMVFFGIRSYRDSISDGVIGFGKAFQVGIHYGGRHCVLRGHVGSHLLQIRPGLQ